MKINTKEESQYYDELEQKFSKLGMMEKPLAKNIVEIYKGNLYTGINYYELIRINLETIYSGDKLLTPIIGAVKKMFGAVKENGNSFFAPLLNVAVKLLGEGPGDIYKYIIEHKLEYPYSTGLYRRPFRTRDVGCHLYSLVDKLCALMEIYKQDFSILDYLRTAKYPVNNPVISDIIAYEIDKNNEAVLEALREIIYGDNNTALLSTVMIRGIFLSHNPEAYKMMGQLLVAARLQEGLRQSIVENMDEGTIEAAAYMLKVILDHNLIRYSSVVRALGVWTGLGFEAANIKVINQCMEYAYHCLSDEGILEQYIESGDTNKLYMGLWATAVREEKSLYDRIDQVMEKGQTYQKITAQYLLTQSQNEDLRFNIAQRYLDENDKELQYWILNNYTYECQYEWNYHAERGKYTTKLRINKAPGLRDKKERQRQFYLLKAMLINMPQREFAFPSKVFDWIHITFSNDLIANKILYIMAYDKDDDLLEELLALKEVVSPETRGRLIEHFISPKGGKLQRTYLFDSLSDKSMSNREKALEKIKTMSLTGEEVERVENILALKTGTLRQSAIKILVELNKTQLHTTIDRLLKSKNELQRLGALELIIEKREEMNPTQIQELIHKLPSIEKSTEKERILIEKLLDRKDTNKKLFDPDQEPNVQKSKAYQGFKVKDIFSMPENRIKEYYKGLANLIHQHRAYEYEVNWETGYKQTYLLGTKLEPLFLRHNRAESTMAIEAYPLSNLWIDYQKECNLNSMELIELAFYCQGQQLYQYFTNTLSLWYKNEYKKLSPWKKNLLLELYPKEKIKDIVGFLEELEYSQQVRTLVLTFLEDAERKEIFNNTIKVLNGIILAMKEDDPEESYFCKEILTSPWIDWTHKSIFDDTSFGEFFLANYRLYQLNKFKSFYPPIEEFIRGYDLGLINSNEIYRELMSRMHSHEHIRRITFAKNEIPSKHPSIQPFLDNVLQSILEIELKRGDLATEVTELAMAINYYEGMAYFVRILTRLDKEAFVRGYIYSYGGNVTKKETFSHLLRVCHPRKGEDEKLLEQMLKGKKISNERLLEAAMYAPQWIDIIARYLGWEGLRSGAWYFHAHINEAFTAEKETIVAQYSPIAPFEFNDGAFDIDWFKETYYSLGKDRFNLLYKCAKYISGGANHRRSQLFADATLGRLKLEELKQSVKAKRNKDHLLCYSLIPIHTDDEGDVLKRYEFIQEFSNEGKKFGSQRRSSELKAVAIALDNLARNAGYQDVIRLTWNMESQKMQTIIPYLEPKDIEDISVQLVIDQEGRADIKTTKGGKALKSFPTKYNKHDYILKLKEIKSELRLQYSRAKATLERAMETGNTFTLKELNNLMENPVLAPLLKTLIFKTDRFLGYYRNEALEFLGESCTLASDVVIGIAHPVDLYESGRWSAFQRDLFEAKIKQPFKQVFRELYLPNQDEVANKVLSRRYAGHQIQPKKTVSLLKNRQWTISYGEGLQRVYYHENIIARIYALADWFSPSEVECPTIEAVEFLDRRTFEPIEIERVPKIIFSEIMRDVDLVVSIAHVGGVDPVASLSTIDMRRSIVMESLRLMKIENVKIEGNYAHIEGKLGQFAVHLGSAMAYKQASGALNIIPVHSQHRGRIFLPFMDEDPKTAEIVSKIMLLAQDTKIKDPYLLDQIR